MTTSITEGCHVERICFHRATLIGSSGGHQIGFLARFTNRKDGRTSFLEGVGLARILSAIEDLQSPSQSPMSIWVGNGVEELRDQLFTGSDLLKQLNESPADGAW